MTAPIPEQPPASGPVPALSIRGLAKRFGGKIAVDGISLDVPAGSFFGIVGPNGAGKTTTLSMATGLLRPDFGTAVVHGVDVWQHPLEAKRLMGILPDGVRLFDRLTGEQLITYAGLLRGMDKAVVAARVSDLLAAMDLAQDAGTLVVDYSAGMTKKIALASALIHAPRLLVLDEPFEAVDPVSAANIRSILDRYVDSGGTVIVSSHVMDLVQRMCDHVAVVAKGRLLARGPIRTAGRRPQPHGRAGMVAHLLRLKLTLLRNGLRRSPWQLVGMAIAGLYALGVVATLVIALVLLRNAGPVTAHTAVVLGGSAAVLGWAVVPVVASATDMTLDPARFTTFAVPMKQLLAGLALGGLIGIPGLATALVSLSTVVTWSRGVLPALAALAGACLGVMTCIVLAKVVTTATASLAASRRFKDISALAFMVPLVLLGPLVAGVGRGISGSTGFLPDFARALSWTPLGAPWSLAGDIASGRPAEAAVKLVMAVAVLGALAWCWKLLLG